MVKSGRGQSCEISSLSCLKPAELAMEVVDADFLRKGVVEVRLEGIDVEGNKAGPAGSLV